MRKSLRLLLPLLSVSLLCLVANIRPADAFTSNECTTKAGADYCAAAVDPVVVECCKCHSPCSNGAFNPEFSECVSKKEKCPAPLCAHLVVADKCKTNADCPPTDTNPCTTPMCLDFTAEGTCPDGTQWTDQYKKCSDVDFPIPGCGESCTTKYASLPEQTCCEKGLDPNANPAEWKCCVKGFDKAVSLDKWDCCLQNIAKNVDPGTPAIPTPCPPGECPPCPLCPQCPLPEECPPPRQCPECPSPGECPPPRECPQCPPPGECPPPPPPPPCPECPGEGGTCPECPPPQDPKIPQVDCSLIGDPKMKACCFENGGLLWFVIDACVDDGPGAAGDCNIIVNIGGDFVNQGDLNLCCQVINNSGTIADSNISQACGNMGGPGGSGTATGSDTPTETSGAAALGTCRVDAEVKDTVDGKQFALDPSGKGVAWLVSYTPSVPAASIGSVTLSQISGSRLTVEGEANTEGAGLEVTSPKTLTTKSVVDASSLAPIKVYTPSIAGKDIRDQSFRPKFTVQVQIADPQGATLETLTCNNESFIEAKGGGCGCDFAGPRDSETDAKQAGLVLMLGSLTLLLLRGARKSFRI